MNNVDETLVHRSRVCSQATRQYGEQDHLQERQVKQ